MPRKTTRTKDGEAEAAAPETEEATVAGDKTTAKAAADEASKDAKEAVEAAEAASAEAEEADDDDDDKSSRKKDKRKLSFETGLPREEAVAYFEAIVEGLKKGNVTFRQGDEALELAIGPHVEVEVKASRKGDKGKIAFEIAWRDAGDQSLSITAG